MKNRNRPVEKFERSCVRPKRGRTLVVGSYITEGKLDQRLFYADAVGIDMREGPGVDVVLDLEQPLPDGLGTFDHVDCLSVLEHSRRPWLMAANIERLMNPGATLYVLAPFAWRRHAHPDDYYRFTINGVKALFSEIDWLDSAWASVRLTREYKVKRTEIDGHPYIARTEVCLFGRKP